MGNTVSGLATKSLRQAELLNVVSVTDNLIDTWETISDGIQNSLADENDDNIFRILLPNI